MNQLNQFTCLCYQNTNFLIPNEFVFTASCCDETNFVVNSDDNQQRINFSGEELCFVDFDKCVKFFNVEPKNSQIKTAIIIKNENLFEKEQYYALLTSGECRVEFVDEEDFSKPSEFYSKFFNEIGIEAMNFNEKIVNYKININKFLGKVNAKDIIS